ncbi:uncharacterized protein LOC135143448 [Zophobas morio]|uniref:uncharacterized protein LOC135143448 n=1 Tax=Zophobas morio TaxID=2755281 RepID=UPI003083AD05
MSEPPDYGEKGNISKEEEASYSKELAADGLPSYHSTLNDFKEKDSYQEDNFPTEPPPDYNSILHQTKRPSNSNTVYALEISADEFYAKPTPLKSKLYLLKNAIRCSRCGRKLLIEDQKMVKCGFCKTITCRKDAVPIDPQTKFIRCSGSCFGLFIVPKDEGEYICPVENKLFPVNDLLK